jgi:hypothetical protein
MAAYAARANADAGPEPRFAVYRVPRDGRTMEAEFTKLQLVVSPGDDGEPVNCTAHTARPHTPSPNL